MKSKFLLIVVAAMAFAPSIMAKHTPSPQGETELQNGTAAWTLGGHYGLNENTQTVVSGPYTGSLGEGNYTGTIDGIAGVVSCPMFDILCQAPGAVTFVLRAPPPKCTITMEGTGDGYIGFYSRSFEATRWFQLSLMVTSARGKCPVREGKFELTYLSRLIWEQISPDYPPPGSFGFGTLTGPLPN